MEKEGAQRSPSSPPLAPYPPPPPPPLKGVDRAYEECSIAELLDAPPSALSGLAPWTDEVLAGVGINTVGQLGRWKFAHWAEALNILSEVESADDSS